MTENTLKRSTRPRRTSKRMFVASFIAAFSFTATSAFAFAFGPVIVYDPAQHAENLRQVITVLDQIERATTQIRNQWKMLQKLPISVGRSLGIAGERLVRHMYPTLPLPITDMGRLTDLTDSQLPLDFSDIDPDWLDNTKPQWTYAARENIAAQRELQNEIYENFQITTLRVEQLIRASNGEGYSPEQKPGQTAVLQAHNELLGSLAHEANNVIALRTARLRAEHQRHLQEQSAAAFSRAQRDLVMEDWPTAR